MGYLQQCRLRKLSTAAVIHACTIFVWIFDAYTDFWVWKWDVSRHVARKMYSQNDEKRSLWVLIKITTSWREQWNARKKKRTTNHSIKITSIHLSFLAFRHVCALFRELFLETMNQSPYTSHNIANFIHLWFCEKLDKWHFVKIPIAWWEWRNTRWEKWFGEMLLDILILMAFALHMYLPNTFTSVMSYTAGCVQPEQTSYIIILGESE